MDRWIKGPKSRFYLDRRTVQLRMINQIKSIEQSSLIHSWAILPLTSYQRMATFSTLHKRQGHRHRNYNLMYWNSWNYASHFLFLAKSPSFSLNLSIPLFDSCKKTSLSLSCHNTSFSQIFYHFSLQLRNLLPSDLYLMQHANKTYLSFTSNSIHIMTSTHGNFEMKFKI